MNIALLAGTHSGCGKTSVMLALLQTLTATGLNVSSFKTGPDFLDPLWHQAVTGKPSYNLDTQMVGLENSVYQLQRQADCDVALIEGVMGLFDGRSGVGESGSSLDLARQLNVPVWLVVDVSGMAGSIVPLVQGFVDAAKQKNVTISGIIANRVGSSYHAELIAQLLKDYQQPPLIAFLEKNAPELPERHLGLVLPDSVPNFLPHFHWLDNVTWQNCQLPQQANPHQQRLKNKIIAVARDEAFCFIYPANLDCLIEEGATLEFFSPLAGDTLPHCDAVWLAGGYPELHADTLSKTPTWQSLREFIEEGKPVLAECGGMMVLGKTLIDIEGRAWNMANILPFSTVMHANLVALGYREQKNLRGHEFHFSKRIADEHLPACFALERGDNGVCYKNLRASYIHWYFASDMATVVQWF